MESRPIDYVCVCVWVCLVCGAGCILIDSGGQVSIAFSFSFVLLAVWSECVCVRRASAIERVTTENKSTQRYAHMLPNEVFLYFLHNLLQLHWFMRSIRCARCGTWAWLSERQTTTPTFDCGRRLVLLDGGGSGGVSYVCNSFRLGFVFEVSLNFSPRPTFLRLDTRARASAARRNWLHFAVAAILWDLNDAENSLASMVRILSVKLQCPIMIITIISGNKPADRFIYMSICNYRMAISFHSFLHKKNFQFERRRVYFNLHALMN